MRVIRFEWVPIGMREKEQLCPFSMAGSKGHILVTKGKVVQRGIDFKRKTWFMVTVYDYQKAFFINYPLDIWRWPNFSNNVILFIQILQNIPWTVLPNMRQETQPLRLHVWIYRHLSLTTNSYIREVFSATWVKKECLLRSSNLNLHPYLNYLA